MGTFVLGVLVGWLAEWLFYTFWVKVDENDGDCSAMKAELELKNRQISSLQSQLASVSESTNNQTGAVTSKAKASAKKDTGSISTTVKSATTAKKAAKTTKLTTATKTTSTTTASKPTVVKNTSTAKKSTTKTHPKTKATGDDFTKLSGIGPSMSATLKSLGIDTFKKLAATDDDILRDMLEASGARMNNNKEAMDSWNEQATVAASGDFKALKEMQASLKK